MTINESIIEKAAFAWFAELGYANVYDQHLVPIELAAEHATIRRYLPVRFTRRMTP